MEDWRDFNWALAWFAMGGKSEEGRREDFCTSQLIFYEKIGIVASRLQKSPNFLSSIPFLNSVPVLIVQMSVYMAYAIDLLLFFSLSICVFERCFLRDGLSAECSKSVNAWLVVEAVLLMCLRVMTIMSRKERRGMSLVRLPRKGLTSCVSTYGLLPAYILWTMIGATRMRDVIQQEKCFTNQVDSVYLVGWSVVFFMWGCLYFLQVLYLKTADAPSYWLHFPRTYRFSGRLPSYRSIPRTLREPLLRPFPLSPSQIASLPLSGSGTCSICLETIPSNGRVLPCTHSFHSDCIDPWLASKAVCPNCKRDVMIVPAYLQ